MAMGGPGGDELEGEGGIFADINITPLTDIFLVLLIIFMVTTTAIAEQGAEKGGFKVTLPKGGKGDATAPRDLSVAILADGRVVVGGKVVEEAELRGLLAQAHEKNAETMLLVQADEGVAHGRVVAVMDLARRIGLTRLAIATRAEGR
jgi:biopolymer transport protein ExbD